MTATVETPPLRMTVLGSGSVGLAFAASHAQAGHRVTLLARGSAVPMLRQEGITVTGVCGDHPVEPQRLKVSDVDRPDAEDIACDVLVVATKAYQVRQVLKDLMLRQHEAAEAGAAGSHTRRGVLESSPKAVLLLQNGWGSADEARAVLPSGVPVFSSIMMIGIERRSPTHVNVNVQASPIRVGTLFGAAPEAVDGMKDTVARGQAGFLPITYDDEIEPAILNKFLFNTCLNAIGAITRMTYGELVSNAHARQLITQVADETIRVVRAQRGLPLAPDGTTYVEKTLTPFVLPKAAAHRSSMLQDVEAGRRTEIDYLNGAVVRMGQERGMATPANEAVANLVRARETSITVA
ncbi:MAG: ketopantoate reductase family protein [Rubrivivax sp.]|nr:ketopantoate reductase family protein [Rubrivivax sp.]